MTCLAAPKASVARRRWTSVVLSNQTHLLELSDDSFWTIGRTIVHDDNFVGLTCLCQHARNRLAEETRLIESGDNDRNGHTLTRKARSLEDEPGALAMPI
jgi:hypothetical protein